MINEVLEKLNAIYVEGFYEISKSLLLSLLFVIVLLIIEMLFVGWSESSLLRIKRRGHSISTDILSFILVHTNLSLLFGTVMLFGSAYGAEYMVKKFFGWRIFDYQSQSLFLYFIYIIFLDFVNYWIHRCMHVYRPLWAVHRYHHSASEMTMLNAVRDHPIERALSHLAAAFPAAILGVPPQQYITISLTLQAIGFLKHSNFLTNWGWLGKWIFQSPAAHRIHHGIESKYYNKNYATLFQFWDIIFGTAFHPTKENVKIKIGLIEDAGKNPPLKYLALIFMNFYRQLLHSSVFRFFKKNNSSSY